MLNKKFHKRFVFSNIGSGSLYPYIKKLNDKEIYDFFHKHDFYSIKPRKSNIKQLKKIDVILNETQLIADATNAFFGLSNCHAMTNFRDFEINQIAPKNNVDFAAFKIVFFARVCTLKGIFDLMDVVIKLKSNYPGISLDIYGMKQFNDDESTRFDSIINSCNNITYKGIAKLEDAIYVLSQYDLLCFPTRAITEGVPGTIVESLIAKTPILTSNFTQSTELLSDGANALFFDIFNVDDLESKLVELLTNYDLYYKIKDGAAKLGNKYLYSTNRDMFLKYICGDDIVKEGK